MAGISSIIEKTDTDDISTLFKTILIKIMQEVEIKIRLTPKGIPGIKKKLREIGAHKTRSPIVKDTYFTAPHRDFITTKECLRIRESKSGVVVTYKGATTNEMRKSRHMWKEEINLMLNSSGKDVEKFFEMLDFKKVVSFRKESIFYKVKKQNISIDKIAKIGTFMEIETLIPSGKDKSVAVKDNLKLMQKLGLNKKDMVAKPYRDLVMESIHRT